MTLQTSILRESFSLAVENQPDLIKRFYEVLFENHPELESLFDPRRLPRQQRLLGESLVAVMENLDNPKWLQSNLQALGAKHQDYGVTRPMYAQVGASLVTTLAEAVGDDWSADHDVAWGEAYGAIRDLMLSGEREAPDKTTKAKRRPTSKANSETARTNARPSAGASASRR